MQRSLLFLLCSLSICAAAHAQSTRMDEATIVKKLEAYSNAYPSADLFVHTDKNVYTNNEEIWFCAYLLKCAPASIKEHTVLSVAVIGEDDRKVYLQDKYLMEEGLSAGSIHLPDSIPPGNYRFTATTNVPDKQGNPIALFTQTIIVKSITQRNFTASLSLLDTTVTNGTVRVKVAVTPDATDLRKAQKATIEYCVGKGEKKKVTLKEDAYIITIPAEQLSSAEPVLLTSIQLNYEVQHLNLKLPAVKDQHLAIRFFPEGGNLVDGLQSLVGWEAKNGYGQPVQLTAILCRDNQPIDTVATNSYGMGRFNLKPDSRSRYSVRVASAAYQNKAAEYELPTPVDNAVVLHLPDAVINDTLRLNLYSKQAREVRVLVHNYREAFAFVTVKAQPAGSKMSIVLPAAVKGAAMVTVLDSAARPLAERLFFASYHQKINTLISFAKPAYTKRDSVSVVLKFTDDKGRPIDGMVSVAAVQDNRTDRGNFKDMESYGYLETDLGALPMRYTGRAMQDREYLEHLLLIKGWRRYTWQRMIGAAEKTDSSKQEPFAFMGRIQFDDKPLKKPVVLSLFNGGAFKAITTAADGSFTMERDDLLVEPGRRLLLSVNATNKKGYNVEVENPFLKMAEKVAGEMEPQPRGMVRISESRDLKLDGMDQGKILQEVVIKASRGDNFLYGADAGPNACGDYVCPAKVLNCPNHIGHERNKKPVKGKEYYKTPSGNSELIIYYGCLEETSSFFRISGIYTYREFYGVSADPADKFEPQTLSTLFWKPGLLVKKGEARFAFLTGDITGKFRVVVQGVTENDLIFGEEVFGVK